MLKLQSAFTLFVLFLIIPLFAADVYVAPGGNDTHAGTLTAPFKTLHRAKAAVRTLLPTASNPINVWIRAGTYYLDSTLSFGPGDGGTTAAPVLYSNYKGEKVVVSGGRKITASWMVHSGGIMVATVGTDLGIDQLFLNGKRQVMARYPNLDASIAILNGYAADAISPARAQRWSNPSTGFVRALHNLRWGGNSYKIIGKDPSNNPSVIWVGDNNRGSGMHGTYRMVENLFEELDASGEWFYDRTIGKLYFYQPSGTTLASATIEGAHFEELVRVVGTASVKVRYIAFRGFTFTHTHRTLFTRPYEKLLRGDWTVARAGAVFIADAEQVTVSNCTFDQIGGNGIFISGYNRNHRITDNEFMDIGATAVQTIGLPSAVRYPSTWENHRTDIQDTIIGPLTDNYPMDIEISNNHSENNGVFEKQTAGVNISMSRNIHVNQNTIHRSPRSGININDGTWGGHIIENNDLWDCVLETEDHGPFNSWGRDRFWSYLGFSTLAGNGVQKRPYALLDAMATVVVRHNRILHTSVWGIDLDDGTSNYDVYDNLLLNCGIKFREGFVRKSRNNIFIQGNMTYSVTYAMADDSIMNNIIVNNSPYSFIYTDVPSSGAQFKNNLFWNFGKQITMPSVDWYTLQDALSKTGDPLFLLPATNNYQVTSGSPALPVGFVNFPMTGFGKPGAPQCPTIIYGLSSTTNEDNREPLMGSSIMSITSEALKSATGLPDFDGACFITLDQSSYAKAQGFRQLDVIRQLKGQLITTIGSFWSVYNRIQPGSQVSAVIWRDQSSATVTFVKQSGSETVNDSSGTMYTGGWKRSIKRGLGDLNDDVCYATDNGASFEFTFNGTGIEYVNEQYSDMGDVDMYLDGVFVATVNCRETVRRVRQAVFSQKNLAPGIHTLRGVKKNGIYMCVDGFTIYSDLVNTVSPNAVLVSGKPYLRARSMRGELHISYGVSMGSITVLALDGKTVFKQELSESKAGMHNVILKTKINSGVYIVRLATPYGVLHTRVTAVQ